MLKRIANLIGGNYNEIEIKKLQPIVDKINKLDEKWMDLTDEQIKAKTNEFKLRISQGSSLDDILTEAFATVKQACRRLVGKEFNVKGEKKIWNMIPYDVQLIGGIILHKGKIAEMKTGEGKTLVASLPIYLNSLTGKGVHLVTVNDYLASRDGEWMKGLYERLGLSVGIVTKGVEIYKRKEEYSKDITYVENSELGFDYLRDNLVQSIEERNLLRRPLNFAIIDEVDSILIDEARTPLIISEPSESPTDKYKYYAKIVKTLIPAKGKKKVSKGFLHELIHEETEEEKNNQKGDYFIDEKAKTALLSSQGIAKLEKMLGVKNLYKDLGYQEIHHIEAALKAESCYKRDKEYIVRNGEVLIVDEHTGRAMEGRRFSEGLHQAIEAKEGLEIKKESKTMATITYQNFFKIYKKLAGMTGTATTEGEEFDKIYNLEVIAIPTNKPVIRVDKKDKVYFNQNAKRKKITEDIKFYHESGVPILIGTSSIATSEYVSKLLQQNNITHSVLNAKYHEKEALIVSNAGKYKSIVVATNMAGRGTDIKLEKNLNEKISKNYVNWISKNTKQGKNIQINLFSKTEYELTINAIKEYFNIDEKKITEMTSGCNIDGSHWKIDFKKQKKNSDPFAIININNNKKQNNDNKENEDNKIIKDFHYGLFILGTEKHESRRIDNQLRGRAGRQGDPGYSVFYVALDDEIMRKMGGEKIQSMAKILLPIKELESIELTQNQFSASIERAQKQMEAWHFSIRKHLFDYDSVVNKHRQTIYNKRDELLKLTNNKTIDNNELETSVNTLLNELKGYLNFVLSNIVNNHIKLGSSIDEFIEQIKKEFFIDLSKDDYLKNKNNLVKFLENVLLNNLDNIVNLFTDKQLLINYFVRIYLQAIDSNRIEHIDDMNRLREKVGLMGYAQLDPLVVYKKEAFEKYNTLLSIIKKQTVSGIFITDWEKVLGGGNIQTTNSNEEQQMMGILEDVVGNIKLPNNKENINNKIIYQDEDGYEIFETKEKDNVINTNTKNKLRPNDKVTVVYENGIYEYDIKYKKIKSDLDEGKCKIVS